MEQPLAPMASQALRGKGRAFLQGLHCLGKGRSSLGAGSSLSAWQGKGRVGRSRLGRRTASVGQGGLGNGLAVSGAMGERV